MGRLIPLDVKGFTRMKISEEGINSRFNVKSFFIITLSFGNYQFSSFLKLKIDGRKSHRAKNGYIADLTK